jgi:hypothetical protein
VVVSSVDDTHETPEVDLQKTVDAGARHRRKRGWESRGRIFNSFFVTRRR